VSTSEETGRRSGRAVKPLSSALRAEIAAPPASADLEIASPGDGHNQQYVRGDRAVLIGMAGLPA
jgi:hypothetical protein